MSFQPAPPHAPQNGRPARGVGGRLAAGLSIGLAIGLLLSLLLESFALRSFARSLMASKSVTPRT